MGGFVSKVTDFVGLTNYGDQEDAARDATNAQLAATDKQLAQQKEADILQAQRLQPFVDIGKNNIAPYQNLLTRSGQMDYLTDNPMFDAAVNKQNEELKYASAAGGRANSGDIRNALFQNYLASGESTIDRQINRLLGAIGIGQASATGQAANSLGIANNVSNIFGNQGDIRSSGIMAGQNINNAATSGGANLLMQGGLAWAGAGFPGMSGLTSMFGGSSPGSAISDYTGNAFSNWAAGAR
jgi:hypothetical protein